MGKILLFVSFVVTLLSAVLGFINKGKFADAAQQIQSTQASLTQANAKLASQEKTLKETKDNVTALSASRDQAMADLTAAKADLEKDKSTITDLTASNTSAEAENTKVKADLEAANQRVKELEATPSATPASSNDQEARIKELETLNTKLQGDIDSAHTELASYKTREASRATVAVHKNLEGRVLAVNPAWNFVVINLGDKNGVSNNSELLVKRGSQLVGKVRITSVEPSTSIADIVANSVPSGITISPNDQVIFETVQE